MGNRTDADGNLRRERPFFRRAAGLADVSRRPPVFPRLLDRQDSRRMDLQQEAIINKFLEETSDESLVVVDDIRDKLSW